MNDKITHDAINEAFAKRLLDAVPRTSTLRTWAALGTYAKRSDLQQAPDSTGSGDDGAGGLVCEGGGPIA